MNSLLFLFPFFFQVNLSLTSTFGEYRNGHIHSGIDIKANRKIYAIPKGNSFIIKKILHSPFTLKYGGGNTLIIQDDDYFYIYMHIEDIKKDGNKIKIVPGNTGKSCGKHIHLSVFSKKEKSYINPLILFSKNFVQDKIPPKIKSIYVKTHNHFYNADKYRTIRLRKGAKFIINTYDFYAKKVVGIYEINVYKLVRHQKEKIYGLKFDCITYTKKKKNCINGRNFNKIYYKKHFIILPTASFPKGKYKIEIEVRDFWKNKATKQLLIQVL